MKYCSEVCLQYNYCTVHRWECGVLEYVDSQDIGRMATLAYRQMSHTTDTLSVSNSDDDTTGTTLSSMKTHIPGSLIIGLLH